jgi:hypothetical protein
MHRSTLDTLISSVGLIVAVALLAASGGLYWTYTFVHSQVQEQLEAQQIYFPKPGKSIDSLPAEDKAKVAQYAGQQLVTGAQARVFADHYIGVHLKKVAGGQTYAQLSSAAQADPSNTKLAGQVQTMFRGETLRGLLLNAYAFDTMAVVAMYAAWGALAAGLLLLVLAALGFRHASKVRRR